MTEPVRHTVDTITDNDLDQLYAELEQLRQLAAGYAGFYASAEAAITRVRALADRLDLLANAALGTPVSGVDKAIHHTANLIREALAEPKEQPAP